MKTRIASLPIVAVSLTVLLGLPAAQGKDDLILKHKEALPFRPGCRDNPALTGQCYWFAGTYGLSADRGFVVWGHEGGSVILRDAPDSYGRMPENLMLAFEKAQADTGFASASVHGIFEVCPIPSDWPERDWET